MLTCIRFFLSEHFSFKNIHCSIDESLERYAAVIDAADGIPVRGYLSCVIACPYDGPTDPSQVGRRVEQLLQMGCHEVSLGDTIGVGTPATTIYMLDASLAAAGGEADRLAVHFHDT
jgi:hydroxymethylglutaryl-CoA lyase